MKSLRIWDIPTRLFHWSLVILLTISFYTGLSGGFKEMDYHMLSGYCILTLVLFRILWGLIGSHHSKFITFVRGPSKIFQYAKGLLTTRSKDTQLNVNQHAGHNPLGALSIIAILISLVVQASTGLFANDDIMLEGPLSHLVTYDTSRMLTGVHKTNIWVLAALAGLHVCAILFYQFYKKEPLVIAMFTGKKTLDSTEPEADSIVRELSLGTLTLAICAGVVYAIITYL
jgi:cytochrome b